MADRSASWPGWGDLFKAAFPNKREQDSPLAHVPDRVLRVYLALARFANDDGECWPSVAMLARVCGKGRRQIIDALGEGRRLGLFTTHRCIGHKTLLYRLTWPLPTQGQSSADHKAPAGAEIRTGDGGETSAEIRTGPVRKSAPLPVRKSAPRRRSGKKARKKSERSADADPWQRARECMSESLHGAPLDTERFREAWGEWARHRVEIKKPLTPTSIKRQIAQLEKLGHDAAIESIEQSIERGWTGLFPPKDHAPAKSNGSPQRDPASVFQDIQAGRAREAILNGTTIDLTDATAYSERGLKRNGELLIAAADLRRAEIR